MKRLDFITLTLAVLFLASCVDAQRTSRISRPCPASTTPASVEVDREGDVNVTPCPGREIGITAPTLKVYDPTYTGGTASTTSRFLVGSTTPQTIPSTNNFVGVDLQARANMSGSASTDFSGIRNYHAVTGNGTATTYYGIYNQHLESSGFSGSYDGIYGIWNRITPNQGSLTHDLYGIRSFVGSGGFAFTTDAVNTDIIGVYSSVQHGYAVTAANVIAVEATSLGANAPSPGSSVTNLIGVAVSHRASTGTAANNTITNRFGVRIGGYTSPLNYLVTNDYGLYIDSSFDALASTSTYSIYSASVSPSLLSGKLSFDATYTAAGTTGNQTINKPAFSVNFAAAASSLTVTNSFVTSSASVLICTVQTNDSTMKSVAAVAGSGSVVLHANAAATAETKVYCEVKN